MCRPSKRRSIKSGSHSFLDKILLRNCRVKSRYVLCWCYNIAKRSSCLKLTLSIVQNCRRKIWECLGEPENSQPHAKRVKSETIVEAPSVVEAQPESSKAYITKNSSNRAEIEFKVNAMKVVQMREECRKLGLDNKGVKKVLRSRLLEHLLSDANQQPDSPPQDSSEVQQEMTEVSASKSGETNEQNDGNEMKIDDIAIKQESTESEKEDSRMSITSTQAEPKMSTKEPEPSAPQEVDMQTSNASAPENEMNATIVPKTSKVKPQTKDRINGGQQTAVREDYYKDSIPEDDVSLPASDVTTSTVSSKISGTKVRELVSKLSNKSQYTSGTPSSSAPSGSALSKSVQAKKDARMARMAEIREKVSSTLLASHELFGVSNSICSRNTQSHSKQDKQDFLARN